MKFSMTRLFDRMLAEVGLVRRSIYAGQEVYVAFLEAMMAKKVIDMLESKGKKTTKVKKCR